MVKLLVVNTVAPLFILLLYSSSWAAATVMEFDDVEQEQRYTTLTKELRCLVCQNQNLAESNADLAKDLRNKIYEMIKAGLDDTEIVGYMVDRWGDFILYRPPFKSSTIILWVGPFLLLLICLWVLVRISRRKSGESALKLDPAQHERAQRLLEEG